MIRKRFDIFKYREENKRKQRNNQNENEIIEFHSEITTEVEE